MLMLSGDHECCEFAPALFNESGSMTATGTKSSLVKAVKEETKTNSVPHVPPVDRKTTVIVDGMYSI